jgi:LemA protein
MRHTLRIPRIPVIVSLALSANLMLSGCGINNIPTFDEGAKAKWSDVQNQYQRRADLIPNLVATVKGYATQERDVLTQVVEARAKVSQIKVDASTITDPTKFKEYQNAQNTLTGALGRLLVTVERYPELKSPEFSHAAIAARRHRESHSSLASRFYRRRARVQHGTQDHSGGAVGVNPLSSLQTHGNVHRGRRCETSAQS